MEEEDGDEDGVVVVVVVGMEEEMEEKVVEELVVEMEVEKVEMAGQRKARGCVSCCCWLPCLLEREGREKE